MKLPIKKKFFNQIKAGDKNLEWRDAHITFICEETGETLRKDVSSVMIIPKKKYADWEEGMFSSEEEFKQLFTDDMVMGFALK